MKKIICGSGLDRMPGWSFKMMAAMFKVADMLKSPDGRLVPFGIQKGQTVVDYGCGTGRYLKSASAMVGEAGKVYAVDIHELAVDSARNAIQKFGLKNIVPVLTDGKRCAVPDHSADLVYALDMFHMVSEPDIFLKELHRMTRPGGTLILEDGHQPRKESRKKVESSGCWAIISENPQFMKCLPKA